MTRKFEYQVIFIQDELVVHVTDKQSQKHVQ